MTSWLAALAAGLNVAANGIGRYALAPLGMLPGWLSATLVAGVTGVLLLLVFKFTSNQVAIDRVRRDIDAHLLALKLFKDSAQVALRAQGRILAGAGRLFLLAIVPMLVMALPVTLLLGQLGLWYESRPLRVGEETVVTLGLGGGPDSPWPAVSLQPTDAFEVEAGPVRVRSQREVCWNVKALRPGEHRLVFQVGDRSVVKELAIGDGLMRVSAVRPGWDATSILLNPWEEPFRPVDPVRSIAIDYPGRSSWTCGRGVWLIYWFVVSMAAALCLRGTLGVKV